MNDEQPPSRTRKKSKRIVLLVLIALMLLLLLWFVRANVRDDPADMPARPTPKSRPDSSSNVPDTSDRSVNQGGSPADDSTPDPNGTGANTMLEETAPAQ